MSQPLPDIVVDTKLRCEVYKARTIHSYKAVIEPNRPPREVEEIWKKKRKLGRGRYGTVWLETCTAGERQGQSRAVKEIEHCSRNFNTSIVVRELEAIGRLSQKNVRERLGT